MVTISNIPVLWGPGPIWPSSQSPCLIENQTRFRPKRYDRGKKKWEASITKTPIYHLTMADSRTPRQPRPIPNGAAKIVLIIISFVFPPLTVLILKDFEFFNWELGVSVILTIIGGLPGALFSLWYLLFGFPDELAKFNEREGYVQLRDDEEGPTGPATQNQSHNHHKQNQQTTQQGPSDSSPLNASFGTGPVEGGSDLPKYEDVATNGHRADVKSGDNKIQH